MGPVTACAKEMRLPYVAQLKLPLSESALQKKQS